MINDYGLIDLLALAISVALVSSVVSVYVETKIEDRWPRLHRWTQPILMMAFNLALCIMLALFVVNVLL